MALALRHVKDPVPSVRALRPDVPERVDAVVKRAMAKRPQDRFRSMDELAGALESCLAEVLETKARGREEDTGVLAAPPPPPAAAAPRRAAPPAAPARAEPRHTQPTRPRRSGLRIAGVLLLAAVILVGNLLVLEIVFEDGLPGLPGLGGGDPVPVQIEAVSDLDPYGDNTEHPETVGEATDRDPATYWTTEQYRSFAKEGVGIVVDAGSRVALSRVVLVTDTPGFTALIAASNDPGEEFVDVAESREVGRRTTFEVDTRGESYRYYVVWITDLEGVAHLNEVRAFVSG
jgi:serine/threonine-protein kinase